MDSGGKAQKGRGKMGEANYEEAMKEALSEIFQNLKEIEKDSKMKRMKMDLTEEEEMHLQKRSVKQQLH